MNIDYNKYSVLSDHAINDYYNPPKKFIPYLWTSAYGLAIYYH